VGAREYDPEIGRFLQPDPQPTGPELQWGQLNRWAYCANDPVNASDPSGAMSLAGWFGVLGAGIAITAGFALAFAGPATFFAGLALMAAGFALLFETLLNETQDCQKRAMFEELRNYAIAISLAAAGAVFVLALGFGPIFYSGMSAGLAKKAAILSAVGTLGYAAGKFGYNRYR